MLVGGVIAVIATAIACCCQAGFNGLDSRDFVGHWPKLVLPRPHRGLLVFPLVTVLEE